MLEAALGFVDECLLDNSATINASTTAESRSLTSRVKIVNRRLSSPARSAGGESRRSVSNGGPSFAIDCLETSTMIPFQNMKRLRVNARTAGFDRHLLSHRGDSRQKKTNPNRVRDEAQFELVYLRDKVSELESKLRALQLSSPAVEAGVSVSSSPSPLTRMPQVWEGMAGRQSRHREQAEHENARLKVLVERKQRWWLPCARRCRSDSLTR